MPWKWTCGCGKVNWGTTLRCQRCWLVNEKDFKEDGRPRTPMVDPLIQALQEAHPERNPKDT